MKSINLEDRVLNYKSSDAIEDFEPITKNLKMELASKFNRSSDSYKIGDMIEKLIGWYGGIYNSLKSKLESDRKYIKNGDEFYRLYFTYIASEGVRQIMDGNGESILTNTRQSIIPINFNIPLNKTDYSTLQKVIKGICNTSLKGNSLVNVGTGIKRYFEMLSSYAVDGINEPQNSNLRKSYEGVEVIGKGFKVKGIKKPIVINKENNHIQEKEDYKGLEDVLFKQVSRNEIVSNEKGINLVEDTLPALMHFNPKTKSNFFGDDFIQYVLLSGYSGTGKTMIANYAMTLAKNKAKNNGIPLSIVQLNFEDTYQDKPVLNLRKQLNDITEGNRAYIVFIDEIDTKIPNRNNNLREYKRDVVGEFLKFRGEAGYINRGNYLMIATTNATNNIDPAILQVFTKVEVPGPLTAEDKAKVLYKNLLKGMSIGYIKINDSDWPKIGGLLEQYNLNGRDIKEISKESKKKYLLLADQIPYNASEIRKKQLVKKLISNGDQTYITTVNDVINSIENRFKGKLLEQKNYL